MSLDRLDTGSMHCEYNTVVFGPAAYTAYYNVRPNMDPAGRTVMSATYTMTVVDYITSRGGVAGGIPIAPTDPAVKAVIAKLSRNGGKLKYRGRGFGNEEINVGPQKDVNWGPKTTGIECEAVGAGYGVKLTWTVEWTTVNCPDGLTAPGTILQFTYTVGYDLDKEGYTTRNYEATLTIAQTRKAVDSKVLQAAADMHREKMVPALHPMFRREKQSYRLDRSKCTITALVTDVQMPHNLPPSGVVDGSIEHTWQTTVNRYTWAGSISASYDIARKEGKPSDAINHFLALVKERLDEARLMLIDGESGNAAANAAAGQVAGAGAPRGAPAIPLWQLPFLGGAAAAYELWRTRVRPPPAAAPAPPPRKNVFVYLSGGGAAETNVLGRLQVRLNYQYVAVGCTFGEILRSGGLWRPFGKSGVQGWKQWTASIPTAFSPRGHAELRFDPNEDALVDACIPGATPVTLLDNRNSGGGAGGDFGLPKDTDRNTPSGRATIFGFVRGPDKDESWIDYRTGVTIHGEMGRAVGTTLPTAPLTPDVRNEWAAKGGTRDSRGDSQGASIVHQRTRPRYYVTMTGTATRGGWGIPMPTLTEVEGRTPVLVGQPFFQQSVIGYTQVPMVRATWRMTYLFTDS